MDVLYTYVLKDADQSVSFKENMLKLQVWKKDQLRGLPPEKKRLKESSLEFQYSMLKFRFIMRLMDEKGYFGSKII